MEHTARAADGRKSAEPGGSPLTPAAFVTRDGDDALRHANIEMAVEGLARSGMVEQQKSPARRGSSRAFITSKEER